LQLSIPDPEVAKLMSLFSAIVEVSVRLYFFNAFLKAGLKNQGNMTAEETEAYYKRGQLRVQDGNNDM